MLPGYRKRPRLSSGSRSQTRLVLARCQRAAEVPIQQRVCGVQAAPQKGGFQVRLDACGVCIRARLEGKQQLCLERFATGNAGTLPACHRRRRDAYNSRQLGAGELEGCTQREDLFRCHAKQLTGTRASASSVRAETH